jgi:signal transduction histidine kinase
MAHEINNPLAAVTNAVYLALQKSDLDEEVRGILNMADRELARVSQVVTQNLRFHRQLTAPQSANLCDVMESVLMLLGSRLTASNIEIKREYRAQEKLWYFGNDLRHAFASLISNSLDAAVEGMYLRVRIKPGRAWSGSEEPGIRVTVADTGQGIPSHLVKRVFEAFVTTKESTGTGLGLWVTEEIVSKHKGRIALRSSTRLPQHGTVVMLFFPFDGVRKS